MQYLNAIKLLIAVILMSLLVNSCDTRNEYLYESVSTLERGWMEDGWGEMVFYFQNPDEEAIKVLKLEAEWFVGDEAIYSWDWSVNTDISSGDSLEYSLVGWMPPKAAALSKKENCDPVIRGNSYIVRQNDTVLNSFSIRVPVACLEHPLMERKGKYIALELESTTWELVEDADGLLVLMDKIYSAMYELTGNSPYNGEYITYKEGPPNPFFAYAGQTIVLNEEFIENSIDRLASGVIDFGWIHELGNDFDDEIGEWYNYDSFQQFMSNIKLSYTIEKLILENGPYKMESWIDESTFVSGKEFNVEYFVPFGEKYMTSDRTWEEMLGDDYHAMVYTIAQQEGWSFLKETFSMYGELASSELTIPGSNIDKIRLFCTLIQMKSKSDLLPLFEMYKLPVDNDLMNEFAKKYHLF